MGAGHNQHHAGARQSATIIRRFFDDRGGWRGLQAAGVKGLVTSLPWLGKFLEEVVYGLEDEREQEEVMALLVACATHLEEARTTDAAAVVVLDTIKDLLAYSSASTAEAIQQIDVHLDIVAAQLDRLAQGQEAQAEGIADVLRKLDDNFVVKDEVRIHLKRTLAAFDANQIAAEILAAWPPKPMLSIGPTSASILKTITAVRGLVDKANGLLLEATGGESHKITPITEIITGKVRDALSLYERLERQVLENEDVMAAIPGLEGTRSDQDFLVAIPEWCQATRAVAAWAVADVARRFLELSDLQREGEP